MTAVESASLRVPLIKPDLPSLDEVAGAFREVLESGRVTNFGKYVTEFEREASAYLGCHVTSLSSGTMGLLFGLQALGLQRGQRVVLPSFTFMATAQAVLYAGGIPLFADINDDLTLAADDLERILSRHNDVAIVLPVHTYGLPCHVDDIESVVRTAARRQGKAIGVMYDGAHAFGAALADGRRVGTFGDLEVFSLSVTKLLVSVEGGLVSSGDASLIQRIRKMRNYGIDTNYNAEVAGLNGKMSELHAAIGLHNLRRLNDLLDERKRKATYYARRIADQTSFELAPLPSEIRHTYKDFTILTPPQLDGQRNAIMRFLATRGIETRPYFSPPVHEQQFFARFADRALPNTVRAAGRVITLPFYTSITEKEMDYVVDGLSQAQVSCVV